MRKKNINLRTLKVPKNYSSLGTTHCPTIGKIIV